MKHIFLTVMIAICANIGIARINENMEQCAKRYGNHITEYKNGDEITRGYNKNEFLITIRFKNRIAVMIIFTKGEKSNPEQIESNEMNKLLDANSEGYSWKQINYVQEAFKTDDQLKRDEMLDLSLKGIYWIRSDKTVLATYDKNDYTLTIAREDYINKQGNKDDGMEGF